MLPYEIISFGNQAAEMYDGVSSDVAKKGKPTGPNDLNISATTIANNGTLITNNENECGRIDGL